VPCNPRKQLAVAGDVIEVDVGVVSDNSKPIAAQKLHVRHVEAGLDAALWATCCIGVLDGEREG